MIPGSANSLLLTSSGDDGYEIERSLRFNSADSAYLNTNFAAGNRTKWTWSGWVKRSVLGTNRQHIFGNTTSGSGPFGSIEFNSDKLNYYDNGLSASTQVFLTTRVFRDTSAWYHIVIALDTSQSTDATRIKVWVNGVQETTFDSISVQASSSGYLNDAAQHNIGSWTPAAGYYLDAYLADVHFIDGQALAPTDFGKFDSNNVWQAKKFAGSYTTGPIYSNSTDASLTHSSGPTGMFDGSLSTQGGAPGTNNAYVTLVDNVSISSSTGIRIYWNGVGSGQRYIRINGSTVLNDGSAQLTPGWSTQSSFSGTINKIEVQTASSGSWSLSAIEIDGSILTDGTGVNSFHLDFADNSSVSALGTDTSGNSNNWTVNNIQNVDSTSNIPAYTGYSGSNWAVALGNMFDGSLTTYTYPNAYTTGTVNFSPAITGSSIRIRMGASINTTGFTVNGSGVSGVSGPGDRWIDVTSHTSGSLTQITCAYVPGQYSSYVYAIEADGNLVGLASTVSLQGDSFVDTPTNYGDDTGAGGEVRGNYATFNPLHLGSDSTLKNGNLDYTTSNTSWGTNYAFSTIGVTSGKWYAEAKITDFTSIYVYVGIMADPTTWVVSTGSLGYQINGGGYTQGYIYTSAVANQSSLYVYGLNDVIGIALDMDNRTVTYYANGTQIGTPEPLCTNGKVFHFAANGYQQCGQSWNFGQRAWVHTPPSGYKALCTQNLDNPLVKDGSKYFDTKLYTGNSGTAQTISGFNFSPDFVWYKHRSGASSHGLHDIVRGPRKYLNSNSSGAEIDLSTLTAFNSDGFSLGTDGGANGSGTFVSWAWDAGSSNTSIAAGGLNSAAYDSSQTWSNYVTISEGNTGSNYNTDATNAFDGNTSTSTPLFSGNMVSPYSPTTVVFTPPSAITVSTGVRVYMAVNRGQKILVNGTETNSSVSAGWNTVSFTGSLTSLTIGPANAGSSSNIAAIEIDGTVLLNSGVTPPINVPSIASTVRANPSAGFSIVKWEAESSAGTVGHSLNAAPQFIIMKTINNSGAWLVYHTSVGTSKYFELNGSGAPSTNNLVYTNAPTSTVFSPGNGIVNTSAYDEMIAYCFTGVEGYSKFGSYTGNGSADGPFVYTGFRPAFIMVKASSIAGHWLILDAERNTYNLVGNKVAADLSDAENGSNVGSAGLNAFDFLSNGFKSRTNTGSSNSSGATFIFAAFASHPFKTSRAR